MKYHQNDKIHWRGSFKWHNVEIKTQNFNIYNINEVIIQTQMYFFFNWVNRLFSEENKLPEHCLKLESWQGPAQKAKVKQYEIVLSFNASLFIQTRRVCLFSV